MIKYLPKLYPVPSLVFSIYMLDNLSDGFWGSFVGYSQHFMLVFFIISTSFSVLSIYWKIRLEKTSTLYNIPIIVSFAVSIVIILSNTPVKYYEYHNIIGLYLQSFPSNPNVILFKKQYPILDLYLSSTTQKHFTYFTSLQFLWAGLVLLKPQKLAK